MDTSILQLALTFFIVTNPIGNAPAILALVKNFDFKRQRNIIVRESIIALLIAIFFQFFGEVFLGMLQIKPYTVSFCGGILLLLLALQMIFPQPSTIEGTVNHQEPFIVPIATPLLSGPGLLAMVMVFSKQASSPWIITAAISIAWIGITGVLAAAPYMQRLLGKRGMTALEQLMGLVLALIGVQLIEKGAILFLETVK